MRLIFWQQRCMNWAKFLLFALLFFQKSVIEKEKWKKTSENIWKICNKVLTFAPAFRKEAIERLTTWTKAWCFELCFFYYLLSPFRQERRREKEKKEKTSENIWKIYLKVLTFATAFWKESQFRQRSDLWEIYINNTSSTRARVKSKTTLGYKTKEPSLL